MSTRIRSPIRNDGLSLNLNCSRWPDSTWAGGSSSSSCTGFCANTNAGTSNNPIRMNVRNAFQTSLGGGNINDTRQNSARCHVRQNLAVAREKQLRSEQRQIRSYKNKASIRCAAFHLRYPFAKKLSSLGACRQWELRDADK